MAHQSEDDRNVAHQALDVRAETIRVVAADIVDATTTEATRPAEGGNAPQHSDFFHGDVEGGLERMRRRLLDLTKRNRLLNYRYSRKGSLRVVDELPDQLFEQLVDGKELFFKPVPRPLGWRPRYPEPDLPGIPQLSATQHAESLGIRTSFDLPHPDDFGRDGAEARHQDRAIQTLHYPEELEGILRSLASAARLTIEETGTNMLYLVFGFLDWYESDESEQVATAPLIMLPVSLRRADPDARTRAYRYAVQHSGEDILANISLQELLKKDFSLELPDFDEDDSPESYFAKLDPIFQHQVKWKLRRHITLTLLSFGKLLMYRDLDPTTWPPGKGPANHQRIREFFEGRQNEVVDFAEEYALDAPALQKLVPQLVDEADSSQHSALVDAVAGHNMVIAGPPGTGKSQTITNLIAAALADGKRVLFVSEKLAALEVVRHRLERLGLGMFCLELHSHKSKKRALLDDIDVRLQRQGTFSDPASLQDKLKALEETKRHLSEYAHLINQPFGALHQRLFDVIWSAARAKAAIGHIAPVLVQQRMRHASSLSLDQADALNRAVSQYSVHLDAASTIGGRLASHPWYGVRNSELTFRDEERLCDSLGSACNAIQALIQAINETHAMVGDEQWIELSIKRLEAATGLIQSLVRPVGGVSELLPRLARTSAPRRIAEFVGWLENWHQVQRNMANSFGELPEYDLETIRGLEGHLDKVGQVAPAISRVQEIDDVLTHILTAAEALSDGSAAVDEVRPLLRASLPADDNSMPLITALLQAVRACPVEQLHLRHDGLVRVNADAILLKVAKDAAGIKRRIANLAERVDVALAPTGADLRAHVLASARARWWSFLNGEFRRARRVYRAISRTGRVTAAHMHRDFRELLEVGGARSEFERNMLYKSVVGPHDSGIESPLAELAAVAAWRTAIRGLLIPLGTRGEEAAESLWSAPTEVLSAFVAVEASRHSRSSRINTAAHHLRQARQLTGNTELVATAWVELAAILNVIASNLRTAKDYLSSVSLPAMVQIETRAQLVTNLRERAGLRARLEGAGDAAELLGEDFRGVLTDLPGLRMTLRYHERVCEVDLPRNVRHWLLQADAVERLDSLSGSLQQACSKGAAAVKAWAEFVDLGKLSAAEWLADLGPLETANLDSVVLRSRRALESRRMFAGWLDYLHSVDDLRQRELGYLVELAEGEKLSTGDLNPALEYVQANSLVEEAFQTHPQLARFSSLSHEQVRKRYAELDKECIQLYRRRAAATIGQRQVPKGVGYGPASGFTELSLVTREIGKQKRHIPLRQLMKRAGNALQALKPCFMMGPLSVAQYLGPGAIQFDLLIVDEASQLRPQDSLGAIARVKQVVIVGDQMQLPPTSFFERLGDIDEDEEEEGSAIEDSESILDVASSLYRPSRMLKWHYRSRHGSLIAFSNKEFYKNGLVVFPSPVPKSRTLGVKFVHVHDGVFDTRRNKVEAQRIVTSALRHMQHRSSETLGIVAMNAPQRELIEEMLEQEMKLHPAAELFVRESETGLEPVFVKNLENVQGDERDVIYISATYGKNPQGHFHQRFGPILSHTGHRRLNVLFTRARKRVVLFSSMKSEDIRVQPGSAWGLRALKGYLAYAETGVLETAQFSGRDPDSDFEIEVAAALRAHGMDVVAQVGVAGYFLDLAIKHPDKADAFILGVECDGATYHSSLSARDRDRLRQSVLEDLGWNVHRVWSTDWFKQRDREVERILSRIEEIRRRAVVEMPIEDEWLKDSDSVDLTGGDRDDDSWVGEIEAQPLSDQEAFTELILLREAISVTDQSITAEDSILRQRMIDLLVRARPRTHEDWQRKIAFDDRIATNGEHVRQYLQRVIEITSKLGR